MRNWNAATGRVGFDSIWVAELDRVVFIQPDARTQGTP